MGFRLCFSQSSSPFYFLRQVVLVLLPGEKEVEKHQSSVWGLKPLRVICGFPKWAHCRLGSRTVL